MRWHDLYARVRFPLMRESHNNGIPLHLDSLAHETAERTFTLIEKHTPLSCEGIGISLPGRWRRSLDDAERVIEHVLIPRLVNGRWADPDEDIDPGNGFLSVTGDSGRQGTAGTDCHP